MPDLLVLRKHRHP